MADANQAQSARFDGSVLSANASPMHLRICAISLSILLVAGCGGEEEEVETVEAEEGADETESDEGSDDELDDDEFDDALDDELDDEFGEDEADELVVDADELLLDDSTRDRVAPERRGLAHILIRYQGADRAGSERRSKSAAEALAQQAYERVQNEDFAAVAAELSDDTANKDHGGEMGTIERGLLPEPIDDALFSMEIGEVRGPVESPLGYHVLTRTE